MDLASIQQQINYGYQQAANILGTSVYWYRPVDYQNAVTPLACLGNMTVRFDPKANFSAAAPNVFGKLLVYGLLDRTNTLAGDYFVQAASQDGTANGATFFIATQQSLTPTLCVQCNDVVSFYRPAANTPGAAYYGGDVSGTGTAIMLNCPAAIIKGPKGQSSIADLPEDVKSPWYEVLVPAFAEIKTFDVMTDSGGSRYIVSSIEQSDLGYRLSVQFAGT